MFEMYYDLVNGPIASSAPGWTERRVYHDLDKALRTMWPYDRKSENRLISRSEDGVQVIHLDIPGVLPSDVKISVKDQILTVTAQRERKGVEGKKPFATYSRSFDVGDVESNGIEATLQHGVLEITIPPLKKSTETVIQVTDGRTKALRQ